MNTITLIFAPLCVIIHAFSSCYFSDFLFISVVLRNFIMMCLVTFFIMLVAKGLLNFLDMRITVFIKFRNSQSLLLLLNHLVNVFSSHCSFKF